MADLSIAVAIIGEDRFSGPMGGVTKTLGGLFEGASKLGMGLFGIKELVGGVADLAGGMISGNAQMETYQSQLETLMGSADLAKDRIAQLAQIGADTPFELPQLVASEKIMMGFGLTTDKTMKLTGKSLDQFRTSIGDMAAGTGTDLSELTNLWGKFGSGATGEAISRLQELGIVTREQLTEVGVEFSKSGELISPLPKAMEAAMKIADSKFGGGMQKLSMTFEGQMSTLSDSFNQAKVAIMAPIFDVLKDSLVGFNQILSGPGFKDGLATVAALMAGSVKSGVEGLRAGFAALQPILMTAQDAFTTIQQVFAGDWSASDSIDPVVNLIGELAGGIKQLADIAGPLLDTVGMAAQAALGGDFTAAAQGLLEVVLNVGETLGPLLQQWATAFLSWIGPMIPPLLQQLVALDLQIANWIYTVALPAIIENLGTWAGAFIDWVAPLIPPLLGELGQLLIQVGSWLLTVALPSLAANLLKWSLAFTEWVAPRIPLLIAELGTLALALTGWIITDALPAIIEKIGEWAGAFIDWVATDVLPKLPGALAGILTSISDWVTGAVDGIIADVADIGIAIVLGIKQGITDAWGNLTGFLGDQLKSLITGGAATIEAHSPSRLAARLIGQPIAQGIAVGITSGGGVVNDAMQAVINAAIKNGIDPLIALALAKAESGLNPNAIGDQGHSVGLFQLHDQGQGAGMSVAQRQDPNVNAGQFLAAHAALYKQLVAEGLAGDKLAETFGRLAEVSDPQFAHRYAEAYRELVAQFGSANLGARTAAAGAAMLATTQQQGVSWAQQMADQQAALTQVLEGQAPPLRNTKDALTAFGSVLGPIERQVASGSISLSTLQFKMVDLARATGLATEPWDRFSAGTITADQAMEQVINSAADAGPQFDALRKYFDSAGSSSREAALQFLQLALNYKQAAPAVDALAAATGQTADQTGQATDAVGDLNQKFTALKPLIGDSTDLVKAFGKMVDDLSTSKLDDQVGAWHHVADSIHDATKELRDYLDAAGSGDVPHFAAGGTTSGGLALVGERGPELAAFPGGTRIIPNSQLSFGGGGGGGDTYYFSFPNYLGSKSELVDAVESGLATKKSRNQRLAFER